MVKRATRRGDGPRFEKADGIEFPARTSRKPHKVDEMLPELSARKLERLAEIERALEGIGRDALDSMLETGAMLAEAEGILEDRYPVWLDSECRMDPAAALACRNVRERFAHRREDLLASGMTPPSAARLARQPEDLVVRVLSAGKDSEVKVTADYLSHEIALHGRQSGRVAAADPATEARLAAKIALAERLFEYLEPSLDQAAESLVAAVSATPPPVVRRRDGLLGFEIDALIREVRRHVAPVEAPLAAAKVAADFLARRVSRHPKDRTMAFSADVAASLALKLPQAFRLSPRPDEMPREMPSPGRDRESVVLEICAGAGGMALGLQKAGFTHAALYEYEARNCTALVKNGFPEEIVICEDVSGLKGLALFRGKVDLLAGSPPCQPYSAAGSRRGEADGRDLFPDVLRLMEEIGPRAVLLENVGGFMERRHQDYRLRILRSMEELGYRVALRRVHARMVGIPQSRERIVILALRPEVAARFRWPFMPEVRTGYLEDFLKPYVLATRHPRARDWVQDPRFLAVRDRFKARDGLDVDAPTILAGEGHDDCRVGGDGTRAIWRDLGFYPDEFFTEAEVRGHGFHARRKEVLASRKENPDLLPITVEMMAALQGFPDGWRFAERKGEARQQIGNAFPPALAQRIGIAVRAALEGRTAKDVGTALEARPPRWLTGRKLGPTYIAPGMMPNPEYVRFERARTGAGMLEEDEVESLLGGPAW